MGISAYIYTDEFVYMIYICIFLCTYIYISIYFVYMFTSGA